MTKKGYVVTGLGPGDDGKGGVVHKISCLRKAHTMIKEGGSNGSHGVCTSRGEKFAFSSWSCGTFEGVRTHLSFRMIISAIGLYNEARVLRYRFGIHNPFDLMTIDEEALCATSYHGIASRLKEMARKNNPRGTIGTGVGEAYRYAQKFPELAIRARDFSRPDLRDLLAAVRDRVRKDLEPIIHGEFLPEDREAVAREIDRLNDDGFLEYVVNCFREVAKSAKVVDHDYVVKNIFSKDGVIIVEKSHGVLTDCYQGFHPHTSALRTLPCFTREMLKGYGYDGEIVNIGVTRAYQIRHGAGPMPTADPEMSENLLPGSHKEENRYQGKIRVGPLDCVLLRYAIASCGGPASFDGLAVTWFDQIQTNGAWHICHRYQKGVKDENYFTPEGEIRVRQGEDEAQLLYQEALGQKLFRCIPEVTTYEAPSAAGKDELYSLCADVLKEKIGIPVRMVSFGPTEKDKVCR